MIYNQMICLPLQHFLFRPDRHLGGRLHHGRALHLPPALPRQLRDRRDLQDLLGAGNSRQEGLAWRFVVPFSFTSFKSPLQGQKLIQSLFRSQIGRLNEFQVSTILGNSTCIHDTSGCQCLQILFWGGFLQYFLRQARRQSAWWRICWGGTQRRGQV